MLSQSEERANEMSLEIECTLMDAEHLTYPDDAFDAVVLNLILSVVPNPNDCVGEVQRVLKPGGRVVVYDKFLSEGQKEVSCGRKCGNCLFTDMNRRLEDILEGSLFATTGDEVVEGLPGRLEGMYRIVTLRNDKNVDVGDEIGSDKLKRASFGQGKRIRRTLLAVAPDRWECDTLAHENLAEGVAFTRLNCSGEGTQREFEVDTRFHVGPLVFNLIAVNLTTASLQIIPAVAPPGTLRTLVELAPTGAIAGINGGYFFRVDRKSFFDDVCFFKSHADALEPVSSSHPNSGVGDGLVIINGTYYAHNCDLPGYARPASMVFSPHSHGTDARIVVQHRGDLLPSGTVAALAAGPNLVTDGKVDVPWDDFNVNIWEHAANAALGLSSDSSVLTLVTGDGHDGCPLRNSTCGISAYPMASFMRCVVKAGSAMELDQGGSTTLWSRKLGVVSKNGESGLRQLFSGLFVVAK